MTKELSLDSATAREHILAGRNEAILVNGLLDLRGVEIEAISADVTCHDLDASDSSLLQSSRISRDAILIPLGKDAKLEPVASKS